MAKHLGSRGAESDAAASSAGDGSHLTHEKEKGFDSGDVNGHHLGGDILPEGAPLRGSGLRGLVDAVDAGQTGLTSFCARICRVYRTRDKLACRRGFNRNRSKTDSTRFSIHGCVHVYIMSGRYWSHSKTPFHRKESGYGTSD